jgi:hypothetical protein
MLFGPGPKFVESFMDQGVHVFLRALPGIDLDDMVSGSRPALAYCAEFFLDTLVQNPEFNRVTCLFLGLYVSVCHRRCNYGFRAHGGMEYTAVLGTVFWGFESLCAYQSLAVSTKFVDVCPYGEMAERQA